MSQKKRLSGTVLFTGLGCAVRTNFFLQKSE